MSRRIAETIMGAVVLGCAGWFFISAYHKSNVMVGQEQTLIYAKFSDVTGVNIGSDVRIGGVKVGSVQEITLDSASFQARIGLQIDKKLALPLDSSAAIVGESLLGGKFVALTPGADTEKMTQGAEIEFTQSSVSLEQLLGKFIFSAGGVDDASDSTSSQKSEDDADFTLP
ncbi:MAG: outer membrane lipid asymmetry maintenance protein MlaD [Alphaproteobacteria bacterium]|nr:MAG: outer membrane lipid asymmetry maintenance protein MlaD [Alphaproteobacteria bacterium]TAF13817.1 MAG: outer membrane lipid asymmetry maintenance protein MlaD [Alphaproteobacteria bacterium]TAF41238.1 MAG: outer membrane lipid asymmetry maintenance protein MlaD [Alphaproteobacteria bacterium]TAF75117.1 MAG: outer membrane lipid asymmetry maintenance protein MlaD [Alphaproteobacteria bacterium]